MISIHAPRTGSDITALEAAERLGLFQSTLPARGATVRTYFRYCACIFQSTLPARGATASSAIFRRSRWNFNPRSPHGERRTRRRQQLLSKGDFNPRSPHGERQRGFFRQRGDADFNPRSPHGERPPMPNSLNCGEWIFQSTLPARGATCACCCIIGCCAAHFNPRSPHGERPCRTATRDGNAPFQSTLPARGAT